jgi:predicted DNA-binding antitoxin AbrB/MazE fold protein
MTIAAKYEHGVFKPLADVEIEEGTLVEVHLPASRPEKPRSIRELGFVGM